MHRETCRRRKRKAGRGQRSHASSRKAAALRPSISGPSRGIWVHITAPTALLPWTANLEEIGDRIFSAIVTRRLRAMGIRDKPIAPASPWRNAFAERLIGMQTF